VRKIFEGDAATLELKLRAGIETSGGNRDRANRLFLQAGDELHCTQQRLEITGKPRTLSLELSNKLALDLFFLRDRSRITGKKITNNCATGGLFVGRPIQRRE